MKDRNIILIGYCNRKPFNQIYLGSIVFRKKDGQYLPYLVETGVSVNKQGSWKNPHELEFMSQVQGQYCVEVPAYGSNFGLVLLLGPEQKFITGTNPKSSGSSGLIGHGGQQLIECFDEIFFKKV
jgi:hypothetical protein